ncbi:MAG: peptidylprolyl isomerase [Candidatus Solibacter sp.]
MKILLTFLLACAAASAQRGKVTVVIETSLGTIEAEMAADAAPLTAANFLRHVDAGHYRNGMFHRTVRPNNQPNNAVKIEVIQGGPAPEAAKFPPVPLERTSLSGILHRDGVLSMARGGPDTATSDFFICIGDQPSLDFGGKRNADGQGFAAFGRVTKGMDVVRKIQTAPAQEQRLTPPVRILRIVRKGA